MEPHELQEHTEHAQHSGQKAVGLTMAVVAVLLALATLLSHRAHTEEILTLTHNVDDWSFYQAKHNRAYTFALTAENEALLTNGKEAAMKNLKTSIEEECGVPAPKDCVGPWLKKFPILQQAHEENKEAAAKTEGAKPEGTESHAGEASTPAAGESAVKHEKSGKEGPVKEGSIHIQERAREGQNEVVLFEKKADRYDTAELCLEVSIVLCSIALLADNRMYWKLSFISTVIGIAMAVWGLLLR